MGHIWKGTCRLLLFLVYLCAGSGMTVMAATAVSDVRISFSGQYGDGVPVEPEISTGYQTELSSISWNKTVEDWKPGKRVEATITLTPADDREFSGTYNKNNCRITGGSFSSAKLDEEGNLIVRAGFIPSVTLGTTEKAGWSDNAKTRAAWKKVPYATAYQLRLYQDDQYIKTITLEGNSIDLSQYMTREASYYYEVKATTKDSSDRNHIRDGEYVTSVNSVLDDLGDIDGTWQTYAQGRKYMDASGQYATLGWKRIMGQWYYFNSEGYAATGWNYIDQKWYYLDSGGVMRTGWITLGDKWYFLEDSGAMKTGWMQYAPQSWYYFNEDGTMAVSTEIEGYTIDDKGICIR